MFCIEKSRKNILHNEIQKPYFQGLVDFLEHEVKIGKIIYPSVSDVFSACALTPRDDVHVVILGQDPYHGANQAHGLAFSVPLGVAIPPSLRNIYQEIVDDIGSLVSGSGDLSAWARQGVLLLNTTLTVEAHKPLSHHNKGRERLTDVMISQISEQKEGIIFLLRGGHAQKKANLIDTSKHHVLMAPHPSPLSAYRGRFGSKHFSQTNHLLQKMGKKKIVR